MAERVGLTPAAAELLRRLVSLHGPVMFHQSGGCCDGSASMCYPAGEFRTGASDVHLGDLSVEGIDDVPVWMSGPQFDYWKHTHLTIDVVPGREADSPWRRRKGSASWSGPGCSAMRSRLS